MGNTTETKTAVDSKVKVDLPVISINSNLLVRKMMGIKGTTFIQLFSTTEPKMNKTGNALYGNVVKDSITNCIVGFNYENMVNNARKRELSAEIKQACIDNGVPQDVIDQFEGEVIGLAEKAAENFKSAGRRWGKHFPVAVNFDTETLKWVETLSRILIHHEKDGEDRFYLQVAVLNSKTPVYRYKETGCVLSEADLAIAKSFMPKKKEGERQELKNPIVVRDYRIDNVKKLHINKQRYVVSK